MIGHLVIAAALVATLSPAVAGPANDAPTGLPVFPGAVPITHSAPRTIQMCGHAMKTVGNAKIVNVQQTSYTGSAAKYVSPADKKVLIGLSTVDPPLSAAEIANPKHDCG